MRNMSFALTRDQLVDRSKTVTRRLGWERLRPGELVRAVVKAMGLRKGERVEVLGVIRVISVRREPLSAIDRADVVREGFPAMSPAEFVAMFRSHMGCEADRLVTRIEFELVEQRNGEVGCGSCPGNGRGDATTATSTSTRASRSAATAPIADTRDGGRIKTGSA